MRGDGSHKDFVPSAKGTTNTSPTIGIYLLMLNVPKDPKNNSMASFIFAIVSSRASGG